jgi:hypothetical protein
MNDTEQISKELPYLLTPNEAAEWLGVTSGTLAVWRSTKRYSLDHIKIGYAIRYRAEDVAAFLNVPRKEIENFVEERRREVIVKIIYGLFDPREPEMIYYVGQGRQPDPLKNHWGGFLQSGRATNERLLRWFYKLRREGTAPGCLALENVKDPNTSNAREKYWIRYWKKQNPELCNIRFAN